jgi:hypothetical protein
VPRGLQAVHARHAEDVHQHHVGSPAPGELDGLHAVRGLCHDLDAVTAAVGLAGVASALVIA